MHSDTTSEGGTIRTVLLAGKWLTNGPYSESTRPASPEASGGRGRMAGRRHYDGGGGVSQESDPFCSPGRLTPWRRATVEVGWPGGDAVESRCR